MSLGQGFNALDAIASTVHQILYGKNDTPKDGTLTTETEVDLTELESVVQIYKFANKEIRKWTEVRDNLNGKFKEMIGDSGYGTVNGARVLKVSSVKTSRFDARLFKEDYPELHSTYLVTGEQKRLTLVRDDEETETT